MDPKFDKLHGVTTRSFSIGSKRLADPSAVLDLVSTSRGFLPPRMTELQRINILSPAEGLVVFDTTHQCLFVFQDAEWVAITRHAYLEADTTALSDGFFGYMSSDGVLGKTDAADYLKSLFVGGFTGMPGVVLMNGYMPAKFSATSPLPVAGDRVYLARADAEAGSGAAGKLTTAVPSGYISEVGVVYAVDGPTFLSTYFADVVVYPSRVSVPNQPEVIGATPTGPINGTNRVFLVSDKFVRDVGGRTLRVFYNGVRQEEGYDYVLSESGGFGAGYDTFTVQDKPPKPGDRLMVDYYRR